MTAPLFSINAASEILEVDRRTITKALRHTRPDGKERKQDRWRLRTILDALDQLPGSTGAPTRRRNDYNDDDLKDYRGGWRDPRILASIAEFEKASAKMDAIGDLEERRAFAVAKLGPLLAFQDKTFGQWEGDVVANSQRLAGLWLQELREVRSACRWDEAEADDFMVKPFGYDW
jgi:hypothetical protein